MDALGRGRSRLNDSPNNLEAGRQIVVRRRIVEGQPAIRKAQIGLNVRADHVPFRQVIRPFDYQKPAAGRSRQLQEVGPGVVLEHLGAADVAGVQISTRSTSSSVTSSGRRS